MGLPTTMAMSLTWAQSRSEILVEPTFFFCSLCSSVLTFFVIYSWQALADVHDLPLSVGTSAYDLSASL